MLLQIEERQIEPDITLIQLSGTLALGRESQRVESMVQEKTQAGVRRIILDLSGVDHIDSAGIGVVALAAGTVREAGGKLVVIATGGRVLQLLKLTQLNSIVTVCPSVEEAKQAM